MKFLVTVILSVLLGAAFAPSAGPMVREKFNQALLAAMNALDSDPKGKPEKTVGQMVGEKIDGAVSGAKQEIRKELTSPTATSGTKK